MKTELEEAKNWAKDKSYWEYLNLLRKIAHLDHDITNNNSSNLMALCQKCHLNYDKEHHKKNAKESRKKKMGTMELQFS